MKNYIYSFVAMAGIMLCSCEAEPAVETLNTSDNLVAKEFTASMDPETKALLGGDGKSVSWKAGDKIAVYDNIDPSVAHIFTAQSAGARVNFSGSVASGATRFYAVYPAEAAVSFDSANERFTVQIPEIQYAVEGSFDPRGCVAGAYLEDAGGDPDGLYFKLVNGLLKFSVDYDDVLSVTISNTSRNMSGYYTFDVLSAESAKIANVSESNLADAYKPYRYKDVTLRNEDGTPLTKGAVYYIVSRQSSNSNPFVAPSVSIIREGALVGNKNYTSDLVVARKAVRNFGEFSGLVFSTSRYAAYQLGSDITVAGKTYNIATDGDATLLEADGADYNIRPAFIGASGIYFLKSDGHNFVNGATGSSFNLTGDIVLIADGDNVTYQVDKVLNISSGSLVMKGIDIIHGTTPTNLFSNGSFASTPTLLAFEDCNFRNLSMKIFEPVSGANTHGIKKVYVKDCTIGVTSGLLLFNVQKASTSVAEWEDFVFKNNVVYSTTGSSTTTKILQCSSSSAKDAVLNLDVENCTLYNIAHNGSIFNFPKFKTVLISGVLHFVADGTDPGGNSKLFSSVLDAALLNHTGSVTNYGFYGTLSGTYEARVCDSKDRIGGVTNAVTTLDTYPFVSATPLTEGFELISKYKSLYGPQ